MASDAPPPPGPPTPERPSQPTGPSSVSNDKTASNPVPTPDTIPFEQIRERAYELWERNHRPEGFEIEFWLLAERELRKERDRRRSTDAPGAFEPPS